MKKNVNSTEIQLNFAYTFVQSCWKMPVTNGNFVSKKKKERKILTTRYVEIQICYFTTQAEVTVIVQKLY